MPSRAAAKQRRLAILHDRHVWEASKRQAKRVRRLHAAWRVIPTFAKLPPAVKLTVKRDTLDRFHEACNQAAIPAADRSPLSLFKALCASKEIHNA